MIDEKKLYYLKLEGALHYNRSVFDAKTEEEKEHFKDSETFRENFGRHYQLVADLFSDRGVAAAFIKSNSPYSISYDEGNGYIISLHIVGDDIVIEEVNSNGKVTTSSYSKHSVCVTPRELELIDMGYGEAVDAFVVNHKNKNIKDMVAAHNVAWEKFIALQQKAIR